MRHAGTAVHEWAGSLGALSEVVIRKVLVRNNGAELASKVISIRGQSSCGKLHLLQPGESNQKGNDRQL